MAQVQPQQAQMIDDISQELCQLKDHQANLVQHCQPLKNLQPNAPAGDATLTMLMKLIGQNTNGGRTSTRNQTHPANDLPNGERTKRNYPNSNSYYSTCVFNLYPKHNRKSCFYKKKNPNHNDAATIENMFGGSTRKTFHYKKM